ncbi:hypothetical protein [Acidimangrovimonas pyrenivorans]|uniref:Uncharacterized protein n=1 Tax=Acidimangrovimonas pyrenivorans TaxID=2030798 RepID=A0ABV7AJC8_9RHOB
MTILLHDGRLKFVRLEIASAEIPILLESHRKNWEAPGRLEAEGQALIASDFPVPRAAKFAADVIRWGGGHRFVGRFNQKNPPERIAVSLQHSEMLLEQDKPAEAVEVLRQLNQLGQSFASKMVRFLAPEKAVIFDSVIRGALGYAETAGGYEAFLSDCRTILNTVAEDHPHLRICDIEAAVFAKLQGY